MSRARSAARRTVEHTADERAACESTLPPECGSVVTRKQKGLGLGLEALLGPQVAAAGADGTSEPPRELPLGTLRAGRYQPRTRFDDTELQELARSIGTHGVMQPIVVRPLADAAGGERYEIVAGERRFRAARLAGLDRVPVVVRDVDDAAAAAMALIENIQRRDLGPLEEARGLKRLVDEFGLTHDAAAQSVGRSRSAASNLLSRCRSCCRTVPSTWGTHARCSPSRALAR